MKKMIIMALAIIISVAAEAKKNEVEFESVRINVPADVRVVRGETYGVRVSAKSKTVKDAIRMKVVDGVLRIDTRDLSAIPDDAALRITIVVPVDCDVKAGTDMVIRSEKVYDHDPYLVAMK